jgi:hypothetical protein
MSLVSSIIAIALLTSCAALQKSRDTARYLLGGATPEMIAEGGSPAHPRAHKRSQSLLVLRSPNRIAHLRAYSERPPWNLMLAFVNRA